MTKNIHAEIIGFDSGWGCRDYGCEDGPSALEADRILYALRDKGVQATWRGELGLKRLENHATCNTKEKTLPVLLEGLHRLSSCVRQAVEENRVPVVIGGDHSSAIGTWSGAAIGAKACEKFGLIWLDAHLDSHTYATSSTGKWGGWWHGQPVSAITGNGLPALQNVGGTMRKISPAHFSIIGAHSFEAAEVEYDLVNGIRVYTLEEVEKRGFRTVFAEALARATKGTSAFGLTVDLDCFQGLDAPGVGTPEGTGLIAAEVLPIIQGIAHKAGFKALEIAEFNPHNDVNGKTRLLIEKLIAGAFTKD